MCPIFHLLGYTYIHPDTSKLQIFYLFFTPFDKLIISWYSWIMSHVLLTALLNVHPSTAIRMMSVKYMLVIWCKIYFYIIFVINLKSALSTGIKNILNTASTLHIFCFIFHTNLSTTKKTHKKILMKK